MTALINAIIIFTLLLPKSIRTAGIILLGADALWLVAIALFVSRR